MFCIACATHNPGLAHCASCGTRLSAGASAVTGVLPNQRHAHQPTRKRTLLRVLMVLPLMVTLAGVGLVFVDYRAEQQTLAAAYARGETALAAGDYAVAMSAFADAGTYGDAGARREAILTEIAPYRATYLDGVDALAAGDYERAIAAFSTVTHDLPGYENADELIAEARLLRTRTLLMELDEAEVRRDWLRAEQLLGLLLADDPDNPVLRERLNRLAVTHAPIVFARNGAIYTIGPDSLDERLITDELRAVWPTWSPDKTKIAFFSSIDDRMANLALFVIDADGTNLTQLAQEVGLEGWPRWSPDGTRIAFTSVTDFDLDKQEGVASIHVVDVLTKAETDYTSGSYHFAFSPSWSPDGTRLAFIAKQIYNRGAAVGRRVQGTLHLLDLRTDVITDLAKNELPFAEYVTWSPTDERLLVYSSEVTSGWSESMITTLAMIDVTTGEVETVTERSENVSIPIWSPDGSRFAFTMGSSVVQVRTVAGEKTWINTPRAVAPLLTWSPDGSRLLAPTYDPAVASMIIVIDEGRTTIDFELTFDFSGVAYGPPQWSAANPLEPASTLEPSS